MPLLGNTTGTTAGTMKGEFIQSDDLTASPPEQSCNNDQDTITASPSPPTIDQDFDDSQCLFCNETTLDLDQNLSHMARSHGLHVETANLLVDVGTLLAYFHLVISRWHECLYCGTQRNIRQAVQQHMLAKRHCKYDITDEDAELRDFYDFSSLKAEEEENRARFATRLSDDLQFTSQTGSRKQLTSKHLVGKRHATKVLSLDEPSTTSPAQSQSESDSNSDDAEATSDSLIRLSARAQKQENTLSTQLAQLRADDRRSLLHLPESKQRALLTTHHRQLEKARRTEQTQRGNLESAGNSFNRLGTIRLVRKPPHTGRVQTLKR